MLSTCNLKLKSCLGKLLSLYVGPFKVIQAIGRNIFKLDLPVVLRVYPVFNILLLHQYMGGRMLPALLEVENKTEYIVNKIVLHRGRPRHYK